MTANPVRLVALIAVVAVLGGGMFVFTSTRGGSSSAATTEPQLLHTSVGHRHKPVAHTPAGHRTASKSVIHTRTHVKARPVHRTAVAPSGLPWAVQDALAHNSVVVVAIVTPKVPVDTLTLAEAKAGASSSKAGFVQVNAYKQSQIGPFDSVVTVSANPAILVMRAPKAVTIQVPGYVDRQSVEQAIDDARIARATAPATPAS